MLRRLPIRILFSIVVIILPNLVVKAQSNIKCNGVVINPTKLEINCSPGFASSHDQIVIYSSDGFDIDVPWEEQLNSTNSTWVFRTGTANQIALLIHFYQDGNNLIAEMFDNSDGNEVINSLIEAGEPTEPPKNSGWTVQVKTQGDWWQKETKKNFNLDILVDGSVRGNFNSEFRYDYQKLLKTDGKVDFEIYVRDPNLNGKPDYELRQDRSPLPEDPLSSGQFRTEIVENTEDDEVPITDTLFWPFLSQRVWSYNKTYNQSLPPIQVDWQKGKIVSIGEFVASRGNPGNYFIYSIRRVLKDLINTTNFENPFAFYDFAQANDGWPDTNIRVDVRLPDEFSAVSLKHPVTVIEYSWDQDHDHSLDYGISVANLLAYDEVIQFPEFSVKAMPFNKLPYWVTNQKYPIATFVEIKNQPYWTAEGIYEYTIEQGGMLAPYGYMLGQLKEPPTEEFSQMPVGFRGEYTFDLNDKPYLYFSTIDRDIHLRGAEAGSWSIDELNKILYSDEDKDGYLDHWTLMIYNRPAQQIIDTGVNLLFSTNEQVTIKHTALSPTIFEILPPANHEEWVQLGNLIEKNDVRFDPGDLQGIFNTVEGATTEINGASLSEYRKTPTGFRFALKLAPSFHCLGENISEICDLTPGGYIITYESNGEITVEPLTSRVLNLSIQDREFKYSLDFPGIINLIIENRGTADSQVLDLVVTAQNTNLISEKMEIERKSVSALSGNSENIQISWQPPKAGEWQITANLMDADGAVLATATKNLNVDQKVINVLQLSSSPLLVSISFLGLASFILLIAVSIGAVSRKKSAG